MARSAPLSRADHNHTFANNKLIADRSLPRRRQPHDPIGLDPNYPVLHNVTRERFMADSVRQAVISTARTRLLPRANAL